MKSYVACLALLMAGVLFPGTALQAAAHKAGNPSENVAAASSGTNRTDRAAGLYLSRGAETNTAAADRRWRALQAERLNVLSAQLNDLLTKYTEEDPRVREIRKRIAEVQKQLASSPAATLPAEGTGTRTTNASSATAKSTGETANAPAEAQAAAISNGANATASTNGPVELASMKEDDKVNKPASAVPAGDEGMNMDHSTPAPTLRGDAVTNAPTRAKGSVKLVSMETLDDTHRLAIGDKLSFRIEEDKNRLEFGDKQRGLSVRTEDEPTPLLVTDSGELEVPYIGRFPAENKTCKQLAYELKAALEKDYFYQATVIVAVDLKTKSRGRVYLTGAVHAPGPQEIPSDEVLTLGKAILRAGGFTDFAERSHVKVTRKGAGSPKVKTLVVNVAEVFDKGKTDRDLPLEPGDLIQIPERLIRF